MPGAGHIRARYHEFSTELQSLCKRAQLDREHLIFNDYLLLVTDWLQGNL